MISIIIPVYNVGKQLLPMLESIRGQSYQSWELILVDDGSRDETPDICDRACASDHRIRCIHQENQGVSAARNRGLLEAAGEYIAFLDGDDRIDPNYLEVLLSACQGADIAVCDVLVEKGGETIRRFTLPDCILTQQQGLCSLLSRQGINSGPCAKLFKKCVLEGLRFPPLRCYEDILFVRDAFCRAEHIAVTNRTAYHYISNSQGAMSGIRSQGLLDVAAATEDILGFLTTRPDLSPECLYATVSHLMQYAYEAIAAPTALGDMLIRLTKKLFRKYMRHILSCSSFSAKEKILYLLFSLSIFWDGKKIRRI